MTSLRNQRPPPSDTSGLGGGYFSRKPQEKEALFKDYGRQWKGSIQINI
jgi:hypothetical protein